MSVHPRFSLLVIFIFTTTLNTLSQDKKSLSVTDIMKFRQVQSAAISNDGKWVVHTAAPDRGDPEVLIYSTDGKSSYTMARGKKPLFSNDGQWVAAVHVVPAGELLKSKPKSEDNKEPKSGLILANTSTGDQHIYDTVQSFNFSNDSRWLVYQNYKEKDEDQIEKRRSDKKTSGPI